jgi:hypothetical protein
MNLLSVTGVSHNYPHHGRVLHEIQLAIAPGNIAVLRRFQAHQHPRQGALAAAAAPEQGHRFAGAVRTGENSMNLLSVTGVSHNYPHHGRVLHEIQHPAVVRVIVAHPGDAE